MDSDRLSPQEQKKPTWQNTKGIRPRRLTRQRAPRHGRVALYLVIRQLHGHSHDQLRRDFATRNNPRLLSGKGNTFFLDADASHPRPTAIVCKHGVIGAGNQGTAPLFLQRASLQLKTSGEGGDIQPDLARQQTSSSDD